MRAIIVVVFVVGAFVAGVFATQIGPVAADTPKRNQWQYQCFEASGVTQVTERSNKMGQQSWELVTSAGSANSTLWCFKRPLWKK
ncbi:MAG: hypothetical protein O7F08_10800 [Deltaproteobacteria bacterium]|nr:hypothetical protein [Deltaproteobacteria bacterium]